MSKNIRENIKLETQKQRSPTSITVESVQPAVTRYRVVGGAHELLIMRPAPIVTVRGLSSVHALLDFERCTNPGVCGNKARKLASLQSLAAGHTVASHGGSQSNAMLALACLCHARGARLTYHVRPLPRWLRNNPTGNLRRALDLGMNLEEHQSASDYEMAIHAARSTPGLFVPQGAAWPGAESGVAGLADDIDRWWRSRNEATPLSVVVPAGTGTTALFLARHVPPSIRVFAVPCVGGPEGLLAQMHELDSKSGAHGVLPEVLAPPPELITPFAAPSGHVLRAWREAAVTHGLLLDLVYGAIAWGTLAAHGYAPCGGASAATLYVHCGGLEGVSTSLRRYEREGLLREGESTADAVDAVANEAQAALLADPTVQTDGFSARALEMVHAGFV